MAKKSKNGNTTPEKELIRIETAVGVIHAHPNEMVDIQISDGIYIPVPAKELTIGSELAYVREGITNIKDHISLEDIHMLLMDGSPVYHKAHETLHTEYKGRKIPIFQKMLVSSVANLSGDKTLEEKLLSGDNLTRAERTEVLESLRLLTNDYKRPTPYADSTLMGWVQGKVLAPEEWKLFETLSKSYELFKPFTEEGENSLHTHWRRYVTRRSGVLSKLSRKARTEDRIEKSSIKTPTEQRTDRINLEIELAYKKYNHLLTTGHTTVEIKAIKKVPIKKTPNKKENAPSILLQGVRKKVPQNIGKTISPYNQRIIYTGLCDELIIAILKYPKMDFTSAQESLVMLLIKKLETPKILNLYLEQGLIAVYFEESNYNELLPFLLTGKSPRHFKRNGQMITNKARKAGDKKFLDEIKENEITRELLKDFEQNQLEEKLKVPKGSLTTTLNLMKRLYPAFAEDPEQILRYSIGLITFFPENNRIFQREVVDIEPEKHPSLSSMLGIPLLENESKRIAYQSADPFPNKRTIINYSNTLK